MGGNESSLRDQANSRTLINERPPFTMGDYESLLRDQANSQTLINQSPSFPTSQKSQEDHTAPTRKAIPQKRTELKSEAKSLPYNYKAIVKDAALDKSSTEKLYQQLYTGVLINQKKQKYWVDQKSDANCFMLYARSLSITWSDDKRFWKWDQHSASDGVSVEVAELLNVCWLEVHGKLDASMLTPKVTYEFVFEVMLTNPCGWEVPVNLKLTFPNGSKKRDTINLMEKPKGVWIELVIGEFKASEDICGEIEFALYEYKGGKWKRGLVIKGVAIRPKNG